MIIGVLSDTHLPYRLAALPDELFEVFAGVDLILHAGDVDRIEYLQPLKTLAPVYAVRGNAHPGDLSWGGRDLPTEIVLSLAGHQVVIRHGHREGWLGWVLKLPELIQSAMIHDGDFHHNTKIIRRLNKQYPQADVVIFGHTHAPCRQKIGKTLFLNPGAIVPPSYMTPSVARLYLTREQITAEIIPLNSQFDRLEKPGLTRLVFKLGRIGLNRLGRLRGKSPRRNYFDNHPGGGYNSSQH